jgi:hypothetical protein
MSPAPRRVLDDSGDRPAKGRRQRPNLDAGRHGSGTPARSRRVFRMGARPRRGANRGRPPGGIRRGQAALPLPLRTPHGTASSAGAGRLLYPVRCERKLPCFCYLPCLLGASHFEANPSAHQLRRPRHGSFRSPPLHPLHPLHAISLASSIPASISGSTASAATLTSGSRPRRASTAPRSTCPACSASSPRRACHPAWRSSP